MSSFEYSPTIIFRIHLIIRESKQNIVERRTEHTLSRKFAFRVGL